MMINRILIHTQRKINETNHVYYEVHNRLAIINRRNFLEIGNGEVITEKRKRNRRS